MTDKHLKKHVKSLVDRVIDCRELSVQALGFSKVVEFKKLRMFVSDSMVVADMTPLAFLSLAEPIEHSDMEAAVVRLYERTAPLLACEHNWIDVTETKDLQMKALLLSLPAHSSRLFQCVACTALARGTALSDLPIAGRGVL